MALGGGSFVTQNKVLPGSYINIVSAAKTNIMLGERGYAALALPLTWGRDEEIFTVTAEEFRRNSLKIFGFAYHAKEAGGLRDLFKNARTLYCYKLMNGGAKAANAMAVAKYKGSVGARISTEILQEAEADAYVARVYLGTRLVYETTVSGIEELKAQENDWVDWTLDSLAVCERTSLAGENLDGAEITAKQHKSFLNEAQSYSFNAVGCLSDEEAIKELYIQEVKDMRDNVGVKYQAVVCNAGNPDYEGVVNVANCLEAVYWTLGAIAGCEVNKSNTNKKYDGEAVIPVKYTQLELETALKSGKFIFHKAGDEIRVLEDINSLITVTEEKGGEFKSNQTVRVADQIASDTAFLFHNKYAGKIPNDASGRISLWNDLVKIHQKLQEIHAIENFRPEDITVNQGETKKAVVVSDIVTVVNAMSQLYMTIMVS